MELSPVSQEVLRCNMNEKTNGVQRIGIMKSVFKDAVSC
jgi:hypothetical protein